MSALAFEAVSACYGVRTVLYDIHCAFEPGCVTGLIGPNGAGKTSLLRVALGGLKPAAGRVLLQGRLLPDWSIEARARAIAYLPQSSEAHWPMRARRVVALGRLPHGAALDSLRPDDVAAMDAALRRCDAAHLAERRMDEISAGERARVLLARALATGAPVLIVDEPAAHLDPAHQLALMALLREEAGRGTAVIVTLHDLPLAARFCDQLVLLRHGRIAAQGPPGQALSDAALAEVFGVGAVRLTGPDGAELLAVTPLPAVHSPPAPHETARA